jgi:ribosomal protein S18 acetylase RimI-like enzyme
MEAIRGPIHPAAENWGFVLEGYNSPPVFMSPWNPPYYHRFFTELGYNKVKDLLVYEADSGKGYSIPGRFDNFYEKFFERYPNISIRPIDTRHMEKDARAIWEISNTALADNWGYVPLELPVMEDMLKKLKLIVDPDAVWMVEDDGKPVGYCLGFPDINVILKRTKGKLLPLGWARLLLGVKKLKDYRLFGLAVHPDWQRNALDALMYINLFRRLAPKSIRLEANYILEDNLNIKNALEKLGLEHIKTYRIYEKPLASA